MSTPADRPSSSGVVERAIDRETERIEYRADAKHAICAEAIGNRAGERLTDAPQQILYRNGESEDVAAPMIGLRQGRQEKAERGARPETDHRDQATANDHDSGRPPIDGFWSFQLSQASTFRKLRREQAPDHIGATQYAPNEYS